MLIRRCMFIFGALIAASFVSAEELPELSSDVRGAAAIAAGVDEDKLDSDTLTTVRTLVLNHRDRVDLTGLEHLVNLESLELTGNTIGDIGPLAHLIHLQYLDLSDNRVQDLSPLSKLEQLRHLNIANNLVVSLTPVSSLTNLTSLNADNNAIESLAPLAALINMGELNVANNRIADLGPLASLVKLRKLDVHHNQLDSMSGIAGMNRLTRLDITNNRIASLEPLGNATNLRVLRADDNPVTALAPLSGLQRLEVLRLSTTRFHGDLTPIGGLSRLRTLYVPRSDIVNVEPLGNLTALRTVNLAHNHIQDARPLVRISLRAITLDLRGNPLNTDSRVIHLPKMRATTLYEGASLASVMPLFRQFAQLDQNRDGALSHLETSVLNPAISFEQFDALDADHSLHITMAELYRFIRPAANSLDVVWLARKHSTRYPDGTKEAPYTNAQEAFSVLKPNGTLMLYGDATLDFPTLHQPMKIVRVEAPAERKPGETVQQQTRSTPATTDSTRVVTPQIRSDYPEPPVPDPESVKEITTLLQEDVTPSSEAPPAPK